MKHLTFSLSTIVLTLLSFNIFASAPCDGASGKYIPNERDATFGGFVASTAKVERQVYLGEGVEVCDQAKINGTVEIIGSNIKVLGNAEIDGNSIKISGNDITVSGKVYDIATIESNSVINGTLQGKSVVTNSLVAEGMVLNNVTVIDNKITGITDSDNLSKEGIILHYAKNLQKLLTDVTIADEYRNYMISGKEGLNLITDQEVKMSFDETNPCNITFDLTYVSNEQYAQAQEVVNFKERDYRVKRTANTIYFKNVSLFSDEQNIKLNFDGPTVTSKIELAAINLNNACKN